MKQYHDLLQTILERGVIKDDRTGIGTKSIFGYQMRFDLQEGFPLVTTKKIHLKSVIYELLWFLRGETNIKFLTDNGVTIWNEWSQSNGDLGRVYGAQWRNWTTYTVEGNEVYKVIFDQIAGVINQIKFNPNSRRLLVNSWNVGELNQMALPPCHYAFQFYVSEGKLSCMVQMRSCDVFLGAPFNIASYALLTQMVAYVTNLQLGELIMTIGDAHLYLNHMEQAKLQLMREFRPLPKMVLNPINRKIDSIFDFEYYDFQLLDYNPHPTIKGDIAV